MIKERGFQDFKISKDMISQGFELVKDQTRKVFVHFISMMKNIEYDVNSTIERFDKEEDPFSNSKSPHRLSSSVEFHDPIFTLDSFVGSIGGSGGSSWSTANLSNSMANILGLSSINIEEERRAEINVECIHPESSPSKCDRVDDRLSARSNHPHLLDPYRRDVLRYFLQDRGS